MWRCVNDQYTNTQINTETHHTHNYALVCGSCGMCNNIKSNQQLKNVEMREIRWVVVTNLPTKRCPKLLLLQVVCGVQKSKSWTIKASDNVPYIYRVGRWKGGCESMRYSA
jgi:hypothetical protein